MNDLKVINERKVLGKDFRFYGSVENPLFLAKDVAEWIEHSDVSTMLRNIDEKEKVTNIICTLGGNQKGKLMPYANKNEGLFELKECFNEKTNWCGTQTLVTPKGRETFRLLCLQPV